MGDAEQGIVHVIGPQLGLTQPGMTIVCGDSHTSTHGAFGALAFGIGTSEVEHVLATQTLPLKPFKTMAIKVDGRAARRRDGQGPDPRGHRPDRHRRRPGLRHRVPRRGHPRAVDGGPHDGLQHVDRGRRPRRHDRAGRDDLRLPQGPRRTRRTGDDWDARRRGLEHAAHRRRRRLRPEVDIDAATLTPFVTWGTNPGQGVPLRRVRARPRGRSPTTTSAAAAERALEYMGLDRRHAAARHRRSTRSSSARAPTAGSRTCAPPPRSCAAAQVADGVRMLVVPGSTRVRLQAEAGGPRRGLHRRRRRVARWPAARCAWA